MIRKGMTAIAAAWLALAASAAQAATPACLTSGDAEALFTVASSRIVRAVVKRCTPLLPAPGMLDGRAEAFANRFEVRATEAMPQAQQALAKMADAPGMPNKSGLKQLSSLLEQENGSEITRLTGHINLQGCGTIDTAFKLLEPMPPQNLSGLLVLIVRILDGDDTKEGKPPLFCPEPKAAVALPMVGSGDKTSRPEAGPLVPTDPDATDPANTATAPAKR